MEKPFVFVCIPLSLGASVADRLAALLRLQNSRFVAHAYPISTHLSCDCGVLFSMLRQKPNETFKLEKSKGDVLAQQVRERTKKRQRDREILSELLFLLLLPRAELEDTIELSRRAMKDRIERSTRERLRCASTTTPSIVSGPIGRVSRGGGGGVPISCQNWGWRLYSSCPIKL